MAKFRTQLSSIAYPFQIAHQQTILCIGSCFAKNMGRHLSNYKFDSSLNPFGILYNPVSISEGINLLLDKEPFLPEDLFEYQGLWHSFYHHGQFSGPDKSAVLDHINVQLKIARTFLQKTDRLILTLGTAAAFQYKKTEKIIANCHKLPGNQFNKKLLSVAGCVLALSQTLKQLQALRPDLEVVLSVSPIRHLRDGLIENQRSKATLLLAAAELEKTFPFVHYFPAYEIMMDDLRDYRFYESDYAHPSVEAIDYIWNYFQDAFFAGDTKAILEEVGKVLQAARHRPFHVASKAHQAFLRKQLGLIEELEEQYRFLDFEAERSGFLEQIDGESI